MFHDRLRLQLPGVGTPVSGPAPPGTPPRAYRVARQEGETLWEGLCDIQDDTEAIRRSDTGREVSPVVAVVYLPLGVVRRVCDLIEHNPESFVVVRRRGAGIEYRFGIIRASRLDGTLTLKAT